MNGKLNKRNVLLALAVFLDIGATLFFFVISIIMLVTMPKNSTLLEEATGFIGFLQKNPTVYLCAFVVPMFLILAANIIALVMYVKKHNKKVEKAKVEVSDLSDADREALKAELLKELTGGASSKKDE